MFWFFFSFCFAFVPCHRCCCYLLCYVIRHLALMLFGVVCHSLPCVVNTYYDVWPSPCNATIVCCGPSSFTLCCCCLPWCIVPRLALLLFVMVHCLHLALLLLFIVVCCYYLCGLLPFALHCYCLLWCIAFTLHYCCLVWCIVHGLALLLFIVVYCPWPYTIVTYCGLSPLFCFTIIFCYGSSSFTLQYCYLLWCVALALHYSSPCVVCCSLLCFATSSLHAFSKFSFHLPLCCYLLWFAIFCLMLLLTCWGDVLPPSCHVQVIKHVRCHMLS